MFAKDFREKARDALRGKWALAIGTTFVATLLGAYTNYPNIVKILYDNREKDFISSNIFLSRIVTTAVIWGVIVFFIGAAIDIGYCRFLINMMRGNEARFEDIFSAFNLFWKSLAMRLLTHIYTLLWGLLLIIPGIIAAYSYAMAPFIMAENPDIGPNEAISKSIAMMDGYRWKLFCLDFSFIGWWILNLFTLGIGTLWLGPYESTARAAFYDYLARGNSEI